MVGPTSTFDEGIARECFEQNVFSFAKCLSTVCRRGTSASAPVSWTQGEINSGGYAEGCLVVAAGFERAAKAEFSETPFTVQEGGEGGKGGGELLTIFVGVAMDDLLLQSAIEAFDDAMGLGLADLGEAGSEAEEEPSTRGRPRCPAATAWDMRS